MDAKDSTRQPNPQNSRTTQKSILNIPAQSTRRSSSTVTFRQLRMVAISMLVVSLVVSSAAGLLFGTWASTNQRVSTWIQKNIFSRNATAVSLTSAVTASQQTVSVTEDSATVDVVKDASPAVVSIVITQDLSKLYSSNNGFPFGFFYDSSQLPQGQQEVGAGSGFIISADGLILTNKHVVSTAEADYTVVLSDGTKYKATVVATDPLNDIALVKIDATNLPTLTLGDSNSLQIGQTVIAIGNTLGQYQNTVTRGIISGLSRTVTAGDNTGSSETLQNIIQTDAAINSGNSGGPLLDITGQVIGMNTAVNASGQSVGFAIPINQVKKDIQSVQTSGKIVTPYLGIRYVLINSDIAQQNTLSVDYGAWVTSGNQSISPVVAGSPAEKAGIIADDIILEIDGQRVDSSHNLSDQIQQHNVDDSISLKILRNGKEITISAKLAEAPTQS
ncbi:MAG: trypsin-like peptidase domain-containing protein [Patescibacteria group bacterium]